MRRMQLYLPLQNAPCSCIFRRATDIRETNFDTVAREASVLRRTKSLLMGDPPFISNKCTSTALMWGTAATLIPALSWGFFCFGLSAVVPVLASIGGALGGELIVSGLMRRFTLWDGSAFLTGLFVGMAMPPGISPLIPATASFFAISVIKGAFGGLGSNWMNPALAGIAFTLLNWPAEMNAWTLPHHLIKLAGISNLDASLTDTLNRSFFSLLGADLPVGYFDLLFGNKSGALGEISAVLLLGASVILIAFKVIRWEIPAYIFGSFAFLTWAFGGLGLGLGNGYFSGDVLLAVLTGPFLLVSLFMAPDPVTSPSSKVGMMIFGIGIGILTFLSRTFGSTVGGIAFAVLMMNCAVPTLAKLDIRASQRRASNAVAMTKGAETHGIR